MKIREILKEERGVRRTKSAFGNHYIYNPTILDIEPGNMIRVAGPAKVDSHRADWGQMVVKVDHKQQIVLVRDYIGGNNEFDDWAHIDDVKVTWNIGGKDKAEERLGGFSDVMKKNKADRKDAEQEQPAQQNKKPVVH